MSNPRNKRIEQPQDVTPYWVDRGYRADIAGSRPSPGEDPKGEAAYQRAFLEAAKSQPPRLPNPSNYQNSPSAQDFMRRQQDMRKRSMDFRASAGDKRLSDADSTTQLLARKLRDPDRSPLIPGKKSTSTSPASNYSANPMSQAPSLLATPRTDMMTPQFSLQSQQNQQAPRLGTMEPFGAPTGPVNKLR